MLKEEDNFISICGFRDVKIQKVNQFLEKAKKIIPCSVQFFNADNVSGAKHLFFAAINAICAIMKNKNISDSLPMETMLYTSGRRQINKAIEIVGLKPTTSKVAVLLIDKKRNNIIRAERLLSKIILGVRDDEILEVRDSEKIMRLKFLFNISDLEIEAVRQEEQDVGDVVTELIIERSALLVFES